MDDCFSLCVFEWRTRMYRQLYVQTHARVTESSEWRNVSTQLMETLLDKSKQLLQLSSCLPHLPSNFFNNFSAFQRSQQWNIFIEKQVVNHSLVTHQPTMEGCTQRSSNAPAQSYNDTHQGMFITPINQPINQPRSQLTLLQSTLSIKRYHPIETRPPSNPPPPQSARFSPSTCSSSCSTWTAWCVE